MQDGLSNGLSNKHHALVVEYGHGGSQDSQGLKDMLDVYVIPIF